jgi:hypothetical protein
MALLYESFATFASSLCALCVKKGYKHKEHEVGTRSSLRGICVAACK